MTDHSLDLQTAIYLACIVPTLPGVQSVRDVPITAPKDGDFPFVLIGESQLVPDGAVKDAGSDDGGVGEFVDLHVWSRDRSQAEAKRICGALYDRFHGVSLTVTGRSSCLVWVRNRRVFTDADGLTRHGIVSLEIIHRS